MVAIAPTTVSARRLQIGLLARPRTVIEVGTVVVRGIGRAACCFDDGVKEEYESPVPGSETVWRTPRLEMLVVNPRPPTDSDVPRFEKFSRKPGKRRTLRWKREPILID